MKIHKNTIFQLILTVISGILIWLFYKIAGHMILELIDPIKYNLENLYRLDHTVLNVICSLIFYFFVYKLFRFFIKQDKTEQKEQETDKKIFKPDFLIAFIIYIAVTILFFSPIISQINKSLIGPPEDNMQGMWNIWWGYQVTDNADLNFSYTNYLYYPDGNTLFYHDFSYLNYFISLILRPLGNLVLIYNILILLSFPLAGIGAFFLIKYLTRNFYGALLGGFVFTFSPYHIAHALHHLNLSTIYFIPLFILFYLKSIKGQKRLHIFLAGAFFLLCAISHWNYFIFNIFFIISSYLYLVIKNKKIFLLKIIGKTSLIVLVPVLILLPIILGMLILGLRYPNIQVNMGGHNDHVADIIAFLIPHPNHLISNVSFIENIRSSFTGNTWETSVYLGIISLLLIILFFKKIITQGSAKYFTGMIIFLLLSCGSYLHFLGKSLPITLPYYFLKYIPFISSARIPARNIVYVYIFLAIIIGFIIKNIHQKYQNKKIFAAIFILIAALFTIDFYAGVKSYTKTHLPLCYQSIKKTDDDFGILNLPIDDQSRPFNYDNFYMLYQTYHKVPIANGYISRQIGATMIDRLDFKNIKNQKKQLLGNNIKYIIIYKKFPTAQNLDIAAYKKNYHLIYDDSENMVFKVK